MKITTSRVANNPLQLISQVNGILVYGPNEGFLESFITNFKKLIIQEKENTNFQYISQQNVKNNPNIIEEALFSIDMFNPGFNFVIIEHGIHITKKIHEKLTEKIDNTFFIINAKQLTPQDKTRVFFEKATNLGSIAFYTENISTISQYIKSLVKEYNRQITPDAVNYIANNINSHRGVIKHEIDKIITYIGIEEEITLQDAQKALYVDIEEQLNHLVLNIFSKDTEKTYLQVHNNLNDINGIALIRLILEYIKKLIEIKSLSQEIGLEQSLQNYKPKIFFMDIPIIKEHLKIWNLQKLKSLFIRFNAFEKKYKDNPSISHILLLQSILAIITSK